MANFLSSLFGGGKSKNPADAAMPYLNQIPQVAQQNLGPWASQGQQAQQQNQGQYNQMIQDPAAFHEKLRSTYSPSEGYKFREDKYRRALEGSAAAGGQLGSPTDQEAHARLVQALSSEDEGAYMDRLYNVLGTGLQGNENIAGRGFQGAGDIANIHGSTLANQGALAYKGQQNQNDQAQATRKMLMQLLGGAIGTFGGPIGAMAGSQIGGALGGGSSKGPSNEDQFFQSMGRF